MVSADKICNFMIQIIVLAIVIVFMMISILDLYPGIFLHPENLDLTFCEL